MTYVLMIECGCSDAERKLTYRKHKRKDAAEIAAENVVHLKSYARALKCVEKEYPGLPEDPKLI